MADPRVEDPDVRRGSETFSAELWQMIERWLMEFDVTPAEIVGNLSRAVYDVHKRCDQIAEESEPEEWKAG